MKTKLAIGLMLLAAVVIVTRLAGLWGKPAVEPPVVAKPPVRDGSATAVVSQAPVSPAMQRSPERAHDDDPTGTIRLEGQVIDDKDAPVAGAHVAIDANPSKQVETDASGNFTFEGLIARDYRLEATSERGYAGPARLRLAPNPEPVTLRLHPGGKVEVVVTEASGGAPIANAEVEFRATLVYHATTDATGVATLANVGSAFAPVTARAPGHAQAAMMLWTSGDPTAPVRVSLALGKGAPISGRVVDDKGKPVAGAQVVAEAASAPFPVTDARRDGAASKPDGTFELPPVGAGTWRVTATHGTYAPAVAPPIVVDGEHPKTGVELVLAAGGVVKGKVVDKAGAAVAGADIAVVVRGNINWRARRQAFTAADGTFAVAGLPRREVDVVASHRAGSSAIVAADLGVKPEVELTIALDLTGAIEGTVVDRAGQGIGDAQVIAEPIFSGGVADRAEWVIRGIQEAVTDQGGAFRFTGLPDGTYRVRAARPGAPESDLDLAKSIEARPGGPKLRLVITADGTITGKVAMKDGSVPPAFTVALGSSYPTPFATADGKFSIAAPAGAQTVVIDGRTFLAAKARDVTVVEGKPTDLGTITVEPGRSVSGRVLDESGSPVAGAKVAAGALLTGGGSDLYIPDESIGAKDATSDAEGRYRLEGFSPAPITIVAGKDTGRSPSVQLPGGADSASLDLVLRKTAGLDGTITRDGKPTGDTIIIANPVGATHSNFFTATGADGTFALDALAPGPYIVYPMIGGGGPRPKDMYIVKVDVALGVRTHVAIDTSPGPTTLTATFKTDAGQPVMGMVFLIQATVAAKMSNDLRDLDQLGVFTDKPTPLYMRVAMGPGPVEIAGVRAGDHTICVVPMSGPPDPTAPPSPVKCQPVKVGTAAKQSVDVVVPASIMPK